MTTDARSDTDVDEGIAAHVETLARRSVAAGRQLAAASCDRKDAALTEAAKALRAKSEQLLAANAVDVERVKAAGKGDAFIDRLILTPARISAMADAVAQIANLPDPVGRVLHATQRPNGLRIERVATPLGVIGMIYESRPNVGADAGALCVKSGNTVILRCGSESLNSTRIIVACMTDGLRAAGLSPDCIQMIDTPDRNAVKALLTAGGLVDLVIPRGGKGLVSLVRDQARVPTLLHLDGNCHTYVHEAADLDKAASVLANAKMRRTGICGATESLVVDRGIAKDFLPRALDALGDCQVRGEAEAQTLDARIKPATPGDFDAEYLDAVLSVKIVDGLEQALRHVAIHSSGHTDAILTEDRAVAEVFLAAIDSAVVMHNTSTQFSDGGEFGMGAEIGIATGKMHARGPVGLEQLTSFKYRVYGDGQVRP